MKLNVLSYENPSPEKDALNVWPHEHKDRSHLLESMAAHRAFKTEKKLNARDLKIVEPTAAEAAQFMNDNHISGHAKSSLRVGLKHDDELIFLITLAESRYAKNYDLELVRLATKVGYQVRGGASKVIKHIQRQHQDKSILTYSNQYHGTGEVYRKVGFKHLGETGHGHFWEKDGQVLHRVQKHRLPELLGITNFDELIKSERTLMIEHGWNLIHDAKSDRWGLASVIDRAEVNERKHHFVYRITRPTIDECFYIGVHSTDDLNDGYLGSGDLIVLSVKQHGKSAHQREILHFLPSRDAASDKEKELVTLELIADPLCLNQIPGGGNVLIPHGTTTGKIWATRGEHEAFIESAWLPGFETKGWKKGRLTENVGLLTANWYKLPDETYIRTYDPPDGAVRAKAASTANRTWVERDGERRLVKTVLETDQVKFEPARTNAGLKVVVNGGERRLVTEEEEQKLLADGWSKPAPPTLGKVGMRSPLGVKKLFQPEEALRLAKEEGWKLATTQLKSAPPQVLWVAAQLGMRLPKKRK